MANVVNYTPFEAAAFQLLDPHGTPLDIAILSATFEAPPGEPVRVPAVQSPVRDVDEHFGDPVASSVRYEADLSFGKPRVDVIVNGSAVAARWRVRRLRVSLRVGKLRKDLVVRGDRVLRLGPFTSPARRFARMPIVYERSFGGTLARSPILGRLKVDLRNPIGVGYKRARSANPEVLTRSPNIAHASLLRRWLRASEPAGFGSVGRGWKSRIRFAGTYDDSWKEEQFPLLPLDFDPRYFQSAPSDQQLRESPEGERVELRGMTPEGRWSFRLPTLKVPAFFFYGNRLERQTLAVDTLRLEPDEYRFTLVARAVTPARRREAPLEEVVLGEMTPGWQLARTWSKPLRDPTGGGGLCPGARYFTL